MQNFRRNYNNNDKEAPHPEGILLDDIIAQVQIQDLGVDQTLG